MMGARWYVVRTQAHADHLAADALSRSGFEVFSPQIKALSSRIENGGEPLFPGYLFLRCDLEFDSLPPFQTSHRLLGWVRFGNDIAWVSDQVVDEIRKRLELIDHEGGLRRRFHSGELVRVVSGAFQGMAEVIDDSKSVQAKVRVVLEFMGRSVLAEITRSDLQPEGDRSVTQYRSTRRTRGKGRWIRMAEPAPLPSG
jgi:transcriptional antiterminator RfaH